MRNDLDEILLFEAKRSLLKRRRILRFSSEKTKKHYVRKLRSLLKERKCTFIENEALSENEVETRKDFDANYNEIRYAIFS